RHLPARDRVEHRIPGLHVPAHLPAVDRRVVMDGHLNHYLVRRGRASWPTLSRRPRWSTNTSKVPRVPTRSMPFARAVVTGGVLVLMGCGGGSSSSSSSSSSSPGPSSAPAADFDKSLDALCAADVAFNRSLPSLQASQHLSAA